MKTVGLSDFIYSKFVVVAFLCRLLNGCLMKIMLEGLFLSVFFFFFPKFPGSLTGKTLMIDVSFLLYPKIFYFNTLKKKIFLYGGKGGGGGVGGGGGGDVKFKVSTYSRFHV